jgi:hypothetical protein
MSHHTWLCVVLKYCSEQTDLGSFFKNQEILGFLKTTELLSPNSRDKNWPELRSGCPLGQQHSAGQ